MKRLAPLLLLAGCATSPHDYANVTGNAVSVTVNNVWNANEGMAVADRHCQQFQKAARPTGQVGPNAFTYDCVTP